MENEISGGLCLLNRDKANIGKSINSVYNIIILFLVAILIFLYIFNITPVSGESMKNTIQDGQTVFMMRNGYTVHRGDVITVNVSNDGDDKVLIKRAIALEGDKVLFVKSADGIHVDLYLCEKGEPSFKKLDEPYIKEKMLVSHHYGYDNGFQLMEYVSEEKISAVDLYNKSDDEKTEKLRSVLEQNCKTVEENSVFFLGDNRNYSSDSRLYGTRALSEVDGKTVAVLKKDSFAEKFLLFLFGYMTAEPTE